MKKFLFILIPLLLASMAFIPPKERFELVSFDRNGDGKIDTHAGVHTSHSMLEEWGAAVAPFREGVVKVSGMWEGFRYYYRLDQPNPVTELYVSPNVEKKYYNSFMVPLQPYTGSLEWFTYIRVVEYSPKRIPPEEDPRTVILQVDELTGNPGNLPSGIWFSSPGFGQGAQYCFKPDDECHLTWYPSNLENGLVVVKFFHYGIKDEVMFHDKATGTYKDFIDYWPTGRN